MSLVLVGDAVEILECVTPDHLFSNPVCACVRSSVCVSPASLLADPVTLGEMCDASRKGTSLLEAA